MHVTAAEQVASVVLYSHLVEYMSSNDVEDDGGCGARWMNWVLVCDIYYRLHRLTKHLTGLQCPISRNRDPGRSDPHKFLQYFAACCPVVVVLYFGWKV